MNPSGIDANKSVAHRSSGLPLKYLRRYALAILSVGVALEASLLLEHFHFRVSSTLLLLFAVAISSWYAGPGPAVLAAILSTTSFYWYFVEPVRTVYINRSEIPRFIMFTAFTALLSWFGTFRRRAEADLRQAHDQLKIELEERSSLLEVLREQANLLDLTHDAVYVRDMKGIIRYWNRGAEMLYGWPAEHAVGKIAHELLKTGAPLPFEQIEAELLGNGHWEGELGKTKKDGTQLVVASRWSLKRDDHGSPAAILVTSNDVTERKRAEEELREGETRFRTFVDHAGDAFFVLDQEQQGRVLDANRQACESLGYTREELIGMAPHDFDPDVDAALLQGIRERIEDGGVCTFETRHRRKDGTAFPVEVRVRPLWHGGRRIHLALARDITERKRTEEDLSRLNRELRAVSNCNQTLLRVTDEQSLLKEICRIVCEDAGYRMAWVGYAKSDEAKSVRPVAWAGAEEGYLANARITWADTERGRGPAGTAIRSGKTCYTQDYATDPQFAPWRESALKRGFRSGIVLPLKDEHAKAFGCLCIYCAHPNAFTSEEIRLLEELAGDMAFGIVTLRSREVRKQAEQEVALLSFALNNVREAALLLDETGHFRYVNEQASRVLGYSRAELLGMTVTDIDPGLPAGRWSDHWLERKQHGSQTFESRHRTRDGRIFPVEISANYFEYGGRAYTLALARDITERKRAEEEVRNVAAQWRATFDAVQDSVLLLDKDFRILRANHAAAEFLGLPLDKVVGRHCYDLTHGTSAAPTECPLAKMRQSRRHEEMEVLARKGGPWLSVSVDPLLDPSGEITQVVHVARDITERRRAEQILRQSEAYLAEAQRLSHTGSWALDVATRKYIYWSEELFRIFGFDPQGGIGSLEEVIRRFHPEDLNRWKENFETSLREKVDTSCECRFVMPDGTVKLLHLVRHPVLNDAGEVVQLVGTTMDITERKRAEEALRRTGAYLADAHRLTHTGAWAGDPTTAPVYWSEEVFRLFGFDPQHGLPTRDEALQRIHPEDLDNFKQAFNRVIHEKVDCEVEFRIALPDGIVKHVHAIGHPVLDANGEVVEVVGTTVDITERKRAEQELREGETRFRTFVDHAGDALFVYDLEQKTVVDVNREACKSLGYTRQELVGNTPAAYHLDSYQAEMESVAQRAMAGETVFDTHWHLRKDGTVFPVEVHTTLISYTGRTFLLMVARDISDRLQAEEQRKRLRQLEADMAHIARVSMMGELAASIAHEVNQPLAGIVSSGGACLRWLAADPPNLGEVREAVRRIVGAGKHAGEVIARIRALTKRTAAPKEKLDLNETIREVLPLVGDEGKRNKVIIRTQLADDIFPILGDQVQLQQVVLNLVMNGIEAMSSVGERERDLVITTRNIDPEQVQVTVEDSGIGIDPNTIQKIFDPFYTTKSTGMGMGLSISRSILQHHGGRLWAAAKDGPGTSFHFTLPKYHEQESNAGV